MRKYSLSCVPLALGMVLMPLAQGAQTPQQQLLEQIRLGEASKREDLVRQSLYRLELMAPDNPQTIAARLRYLLRQGDSAGAKQQLDRLAPGSEVWRQSKTAIMLSTTGGRQRLQQIRLLGVSGRIDEALNAYQQLFNGIPSEGEMAVEYWILAAKLPAQRRQAIAKLQALNAATPGNNGLRGSLARLLFASDRNTEGYEILEQMAKSASGRGEAETLWYGQIDALPVSEESVTALQKFLSLFSAGDLAAAARQRLAEQQKQLADPALSARARGLAALSKGDGGKAIPQLQVALAARPGDGEMMGALGEAYSQQGRRALAVQQLRKAIRAEPDSASRSKWESLLQTNSYWLLITHGDELLKTGHPAAARQKYQQASTLDNADSYALLGLGDVAAAEKDDAVAEGYYLQALRLDRDNSNALRGLANLYRRRSPESATAFIQRLSPAQRRSIDDIERSLEDERLERQAEALESRRCAASAPAARSAKRMGGLRTGKKSLCRRSEE